MIGSKAYLESRILSASPVELTALLYEYAILYTGQAREYLAQRNVAARTERIGRVIAIVGELDSTLNHETGKEISDNLARLYTYMRERLLTANIKQLDAPLVEVETLLTTLSEAWTKVAREQAPPASHSAPENSGTGFSVPFLSEPPLFQTHPFEIAGTSGGNAWTA